DRKKLFDLKLVDRIHERSSPCDQSGKRGFLHQFELGGSNVLVGTTPAARITLRTPAAKPSSKNTIIPHGEIPSQRSISHPTAAPTRTPATSSVESREPRAISAGWGGGCGPTLFWEGRSEGTWPSRSPRRFNLAESAA